jgi:predicted permease
MAPGPEQETPGFVSVKDVLALRLDANLVTLSACETGVGRIARGEGVLGLPRAFVAAGARSVMVSLWKVNDASTARLMDSFYSEMLAQVRAAPGVVAAGAVEYLPFSGVDGDTGLLFDGQAIPTPDKRPRAHFRAVTDGYFETMGIKLMAGRTFAATDRRESAMVGVVNEAAAREWFADGRSTGRKVALDFEAMKFFPDRAPVFDLSLGLREIVGVVQDVRHGGPSEPAQAELYVPFSQRSIGKMTVVVRSSLPAAAILSVLRATITQLDPEQPVGAVTTLPDLIAASMARPRFNTTLLAAFGVLALVLAAIGIYGVMSYFVLLRSRDIGIHVALGATPADVFRLVTRPMLLLAGAGLALGVSAAWETGPALSKLLFGVQPRDPAVLASVVGVVIVAVAGATLAPALKYFAPPLIFCSGSKLFFTPSPAAVAGISCITPPAPFGDSAFALNPDSALAML